MQYYTVNISDEAKQDLTKIFEFIFDESKDFTVATSFVLMLNEVIVESLSFFPAKRPIYKNNIRKFVYPKHKNYVAYFEIFDETKEVMVHVITETSQYTRYMSLS